MGRGWDKFVLLLWKNWLLQKRQRRTTIIEIIVPVFFSALLVIIRSLVEIDVVTEPTLYQPFSPVHFPKHNLSIKSDQDFTINNNTVLSDQAQEVICKFLTTGNLSQIPDSPFEEYYEQMHLGEPDKWVETPLERMVRLNPVLKAVSMQQWIVVYSPASGPLKSLMKDAQQTIPFIGCDVENSAGLLDLLTSPGLTKMPTTDLVLSGVVFADSLATADTLPDKVDVTIRFPGERRVSDLDLALSVEEQKTRFDSLNWQTNLLFPIYQLPGPRNNLENDGGSAGYYKEGFLALQTAISQALLKHHGIQDVPEINLQRFPYPPYMDDPLLQAMEGMVPLIIMLSFVYSAISTVRMITTEKEKQLKEAMKMMGLPNWLHWLAWFVKQVIFFTISIGLITFLLCTPLAGKHLYVLPKSEWSCVLAFLFCFIVAGTTFCFALSSFFSRANTGAIVAGLLWFLCYMPYVFLQDQYTQTSLSMKLGVSVLCNTAMAYGFQIIFMFEGTGAGLQWSNLWSPVTPGDTLTMGHIMGMLIIDAIIYMIIAIYVEGIYPGEFGVPLPWYFPFTRSYWMGEIVNLSDEFVGESDENTDLLEPEPKNLKAGVKIRNLKKVYANGKVAVHGLNLNLYENQITVLLGHNGAGKTTTMSMLTGMYTPTSGTATISGHDIRTDMDGARENLGLCPQHNILFDDLTVKEHLDFFGKLKGLSGKALEEETKRFILLLELVNKTNSPSKSLSGGMKRKLSAAVALCGGSKVVLFDEPTSGMDPAARRAMWDLLQAEKAGRTVLLTTHFMDEADLLGDRIAIMSEGKLKASGSSFFLKKKFGGGYHLIMVKEDHCVPTEVTALLQKYIPNLEPAANIGAELSYHLDDAYQAKFEAMFTELETTRHSLGISSYGVSLTTMEEVFIKVGSDHELGKPDTLDSAISSDTIYTNNETALAIDTHNTLLKNPKLLMNQAWAMLIKYATSTYRNWILYAIVIIIPVLDLSLAILVGKTFDRGADLPARAFNLREYGGGVVTIEEHQEADEGVVAMYKKLIAADRGGIVDLGIDNAINISEYILQRAAADLGTVSQTYLLATSFNGSKITAFFNNQPLHTPPMALSYVYNAILKAYNSNLSLNFVNYPLPYTAETKIELSQQGGTIGFQIAFNMGFSFAFISAYYAVFYIRERVSKAKHLQFVSGVNVSTFWSVAFLWDLLIAIGPILAIFFTLLAWAQEGFSTGEQLGRAVLVMFCSMFATLPLSYIASFWFDIAATGFSRLVMLHVFTGVGSFIVVLVLRTPSLDLIPVSDTLDWIFTFFPIYSLTYSFQNLNTNYMVLKVCEPLSMVCSIYPSVCCKSEAICGPNCVAYQSNYFAWEQPGVGRNIFIFFVVGLILIILLMLKERRVWEMLKYKGKNKVQAVVSGLETTDSDVLAENSRVAGISESARHEYNLLLQNVTKFYGKFNAVKNLNVGVKQGECFGLLGVNGAGKTTTFKMLTGDEEISSGDAYVQGLSLKYSMKQVYQRIGYCPQFDALLDDLTGRETMRIFCLLRGVPNHEVREITERLAKELLFVAHIDKQVKEYSGGNKRKLSTAIALIGDPPVVYLDEPTTGMDPVAKRHLWDVICRVRDAGKTIILTSHSMEECEALCTRLAIMVNGEFLCLGSTQHLKNKYAEGFTLIVKVRKPSQSASRSPPLSPGLRPSLRRLDSAPTEIDLIPVKRFIENNFQGARLREEYQGLLTYQIPTSDLSLARMFGLMESSKAQFNIEDYSLGQTSLEQVFLSFTKYQQNRNNAE